MRKIIILIFLLAYAFASRSQNIFYISTFGAYSKKDLKRDILKDIKRVDKSNVSTSLREEADTLIYNIHDSLNGYEVKFTFNIKQEYSDNVYCDYQVFNFDCTPCSQKILKTFIKMHGFRKLSENKYLSNYSLKSEMRVIYKNGSNGCISLEFRYVDKPKKEYKALYNSLPKSESK